jgi:hypothetical protein
VGSVPERDELRTLRLWSFDEYWKLRKEKNEKGL